MTLNEFEELAHTRRREEQTGARRGGLAEPLLAICHWAPGIQLRLPLHVVRDPGKARLCLHGQKQVLDAAPTVGSQTGAW